VTASDALREASESETSALLSWVGDYLGGDMIIFGGLSYDAKSVYPGAEHGRIKVVSALAWEPDPRRHGAEMSDRGMWMFPAEPSGALRTPFNRTLQSLPGREAAGLIYRRDRVNTPLIVCMPYADSPFADATIVVSGNRAQGVHHPFKAGLREKGIASEIYRWPILSLSGPTEIAADGSTEVTMRVFDNITQQIDTRCNSTIYLEAVSGYLPHTRARLKEGQGTFRVSAMGLLPGEELRVKAGWRYYPGADEISIRVD